MNFPAMRITIKYVGTLIQTRVYSRSKIDLALENPVLLGGDVYKRNWSWRNCRHYIADRTGGFVTAVDSDWRSFSVSVGTPVTHKMVLNAPKVKFYNGYEVPIFGLGTWKASPLSFALDILDPDIFIFHQPY